MALNPYLGFAIGDHDGPGAIRQLLARVNNILRGKINAVVEFTPVAATTSTVVDDTRITPLSVFLIEPTSSGGAVELAAGTMYVDLPTRGDQTCTVTHSTGAAGELFRLVILG